MTSFWQRFSNPTRRPRIAITYERWSEEDVEIGDTDDKGWIDRATRRRRTEAPGWSAPGLPGTTWSER